MKNKLIKFEGSNIEIIKGLNILADAVKITLGPKGRNVIIYDGNKIPHITKDGVTVAKSIKLKDAFKDAGAQLVKSVASKTGDDVGDGTSTSVILTQAIVKEGLKYIAAGIPTIEIKRGIDKTVKIAVQEIKNRAITIEEKDIQNIATISANNDSEIGELVAEAIKQVTKDGVITIEESKTRETYIETVEGVQFSKGYTSNYFITNAETQECILEDVVILLSLKKLNSIKEILPILSWVTENNKSLLIIAEDFDNEFITTLAANRIKGNIKVCTVKAPYIGENKINFLNDLSLISGSNSVVTELSDGVINLNQCGFANRVIVTKDTTTIVNGKGDSKVIKNHITKLKELLEKDPQNFNLKERISKLSGGVAILHIGANSEAELKEKIDRVDDALCATRSALEEGILPGGSTIYVQISKLLSEEKTLGNDILSEALLAPLTCICQNAGVSEQVIINNIKNNPTKGFNALDGTYVDMQKAGIIDPAKVERVALENAASVAGVLLTTGCVIVNEDETPSQSTTFLY